MNAKRANKRGKLQTPRELFAARLRELAGDRTGAELAREWGVTPDAALKYLHGHRLPDLDVWPRIAESLGLSDWRDLLPPADHYKSY